MVSTFVRTNLSVVALVLAAWGVQELVGHHFGELFAFLPFLIAAILVSLIGGGLQPTLLATLLGFLIASYYYVTPGKLGVTGRDNLVTLGVYLVLSMSTGVLAESLQRSRRIATDMAERLHVTFLSMGDAIIVTDPEGTVTTLNPIAASLTGWSEREAVGQPLEVVFPIRQEASGRRAEDPVGRALRDEKVVGLANHTVLVRRNGELLPIEDSAAPVRDAAGRTLGVVLIFRDATEKRKAAMALKASEERLRRVLEHMPVCLDAFDSDGNIIVWNRECERLTGFSASEVIGNPKALEILYPNPDYRHQIMSEWRRLGNAYRDLEWKIATKDGGTRTLAWSNISDDFQVPGWASWGVGFDVTERRRVEEALRESERVAQERLALLDQIYSTAPVGLGLIDREFRVVRINNLLAAMDGKDPDACIGRSVRELVPELSGRIESACRRVFESGESILAQETHGTIPADPHQEHDWLASYYPVHNSDGLVNNVSIVILDITERKRTEEALRAADRRKNEFLSMLAHELRNPLAAIRDAVAVSRLPSNQRENLDCSAVIERQVHHLARLVDDLLDVSRITRGKVLLKCEPVDVSSVIQRAAEAISPAFEQKQQKLTLQLPPDRLMLNADPTRLEQVFRNLLDNAMKYTEEDGTIDVKVTQDQQHAVITVTDSGIGMPHDLISHVFDPFVQGERTLDRSQGGLGIGLTLARQISELHGGSIRATSAGLGRGSTFTVRLPLARQETIQPGECPDALADKSGKSAAKRVLIVEDNVDGAQALRLLLKHVGHEVAMCHAGTLALETAQSFLPDVVLLDLGLPGLDGYQVAKQLRADAALRSAKIIALSGYGQEEDRLRSIAAGFDDHLVKPVDFETLRALLGRR